MDRKLLEVFFEKLDRAQFLDGGMKVLAGQDTPLPIGHGQTISQPSLVLEMTALLSPEPQSRVLEIGTGSGYQTALLAHMAGSVYTIERIKELAEKAKERLTDLGFTHINYKIDDGSEGWQKEAPFDRIMVTAAAGRMPDTLIDQLAKGGRMIIPVGPPGVQELKLVTRDEKGLVTTRTVTLVRFVEMKGKYGWEAKET